MNSAKYIRSQHRFLAFSDSLVHREIAINVLGRNILIHGAGFVKFSVNEGVIEADCFGESESLSKGVRRDDHTKILEGLGVENPNTEVEHAKYVIVHGRVVVFSNEIEHAAVLKGSFFGNTDVESAGFVKFLPLQNGGIKVQVYGESISIGASHRKEDAALIAELFSIS